MILWSVLAILVIILDQAVKIGVASSIAPTDSIRIIPGVIDFVYVKNKGAAFSFLASKTYGIVVLSIVSLLFCAGVIAYIVVKKPKSKLFMTSLMLMFAGAFGNAIDRIFRGYVVDFIETTFMNFPVFNIADIAITVGALLLIIYILFFDKSEG